MKSIQFFSSSPNKKKYATGIEDRKNGSPKRGEPLDHKRTEIFILMAKHMREGQYMGHASKIVRPARLRRKSHSQHTGQALTAAILLSVIHFLVLRALSDQYFDRCDDFDTPKPRA